MNYQSNNIERSNCC